jgi:hypothetical protein
MPDNPIDPKRANIAMGLAVTRWKKFPDDPIAQKLDDPQEWVQEATLMNHYLPAHVMPLGFSFAVVLPNEFSVGITTVRQYAGLIYKHMVPITATLHVHDLAKTAEFAKAAESLSGPAGQKLTAMAGAFVTSQSALDVGGGQ